MSEAFADTNPANPYSDSPAAKSAADDLRAAAEGKTPARALTVAEEKARALKQSAAQKAHQLRDFAGEKAQDLKTAATDKIEAIRDGAEETAIQLKGVAGEQWQDTRVKARELHASMEDYVRANPTKAVLTAAGIGLFLGLISRR
ncbi:hypothetical protein V2O64_02555 [Verrucomicrobiaceae bacterium 227]